MPTFIRTAAGLWINAPLTATAESEPQLFVDVATTSQTGVVKPDGTSITVDPDGTIHAPGGGGGGGGPTTQTDVTSTRLAGIVYQNTGASPRYVTVSILADPNAFTITALTDSNPAPLASVLNTTCTLDQFVTVFFIVLAGNFYTLVPSDLLSANIVNWVEWQ